MTVREIQRQIAPFKDVTDQQVRNYLERWGLKPIGVRQRPQQYPSNSASVIKRKLGLNGTRRAA